MRVDTLIVVGAIFAVFAFLGGTVAFADLTWNRNKHLTSAVARATSARRRP